MGFQAIIEGYAGTKKYENAEDLLATLKVFIEEAKENETIKFTLFSFNNKIVNKTEKKNKDVKYNILSFLSNNPDEQFNVDQISKETNSKVKSCYNALLNLTKNKKIKKQKKKGQKTLYSIRRS